MNNLHNKKRSWYWICYVMLCFLFHAHIIKLKVFNCKYDHIAWSCSSVVCVTGLCTVYSCMCCCPALWSAAVPCTLSAVQQRWQCGQSVWLQFGRAWKWFQAATSQGWHNPQAPTPGCCCPINWGGCGASQNLKYPACPQHPPQCCPSDTPHPEDRGWWAGAEVEGAVGESVCAYKTTELFTGKSCTQIQQTDLACCCLATCLVVSHEGA